MTIIINQALKEEAKRFCEYCNWIRTLMQRPINISSEFDFIYDAFVAGYKVTDVIKVLEDE